MLVSGKGGGLEFGRVIGAGESTGPQPEDVVVYDDTELVVVPDTRWVDEAVGRHKDTAGNVGREVCVGLIGVQDIVPTDLTDAADLGYEGRVDGAFGLTSADHINPLHPQE